MQAYENRLFFLKVTGTGEVAVSAEDALIAQHASLALKRRESSHKDAPVEVLERRARNRGVTSAQVSGVLLSTFNLIFFPIQSCSVRSVKLTEIHVPCSS